MTESEFAASLRSMHRETRDERSCRLADVAETLHNIHDHEFATDTVWTRNRNEDLAS